MKSRVNLIFVIALALICSPSAFAVPAWGLYDDFNSSVIDPSKWIVEFEGGGVAPVIVGDSVSFACQNNSGWSESELEITNKEITGIQADLTFSSFSGTGWAEVSVVLGNDNGYESKIRIFASNGNTPQIEISYEYDHTPIFWEIKEASSFGEVETLGISYEDENFNFFINGANVKSYSVAAFNINFATIGMAGIDSYFSGTADNVMVVIPEANNTWSEGADINDDGIVDFKDFAIMAKHWLERDPHPMVWVYINDPGVSGHESFTGYMSKYETTNAQYCDFLNAALASGDITISSNRVYGADGSNGGTDFVGQVYFDTSNYTSSSQITWNGTSFSVRSRDGYDMGNHPVVEVSWYGATAFCNYYGYRLPTEWEWQAVADYDGSYTYGCGTSIDHSKANYNYDNPLGLSSYPYTSPVNHYPSYGYGMNDMAGNVWKWTSTVSGSYRVIRGGGWPSDDYNCTVSDWHGHSPNGTYGRIGFRVCR